MSGVKTNFASIGKKYSQISALLQQLIDNLEGVIETLKETFDEGQISEVDALVTSYYELEGDVEEFDREVDKLVDLLEGQYEPDSIDEIEKIERISKTLFESVTEFRDCCENLATTLSASGLENQATALRETTSTINDIPEAIQESLLDSNLVMSLKADYFPGELRGEVDELVEELESASEAQRQNTYGILTMIANKDPAAVVPYADRLAEHLGDEPPAAQQNLLTILLLTARSGLNDTIAKEQSLDLLAKSNPDLSVNAACLLAEQSLTTNEADQVITRIKALLDEATNQTVRINSTSVLCTLATSHPEVIRDDEFNIPSLLNDKSPKVVENTLGTIGKLGYTEYAGKIEEVRTNSDDPAVRAEAEEVLQHFDSAY